MAVIYITSNFSTVWIQCMTATCSITQAKLTLEYKHHHVHYFVQKKLYITCITLCYLNDSDISIMFIKVIFPQAQTFLLPILKLNGTDHLKTRFYVSWFRQISGYTLFCHQKCMLFLPHHPPATCGAVSFSAWLRLRKLGHQTHTVIHFPVLWLAG